MAQSGRRQVSRRRQRQAVTERQQWEETAMTVPGLDDIRELAAQLRVDSIRCGSRGRVRPSDVEHVGRRPDGGAADPASALRLAAARRPGQRPPDLLQGARVAAAVLDVQGGRRLRRGADDRVPAVRLAAGGSPHPGAAVGRRGHRLARPGAAGRGRGGPGRPVPRRVAVPGLGAVRRHRDGRGVDVGGAGQGRLLPPAQPHRDRRREPPRPARPDRTGLGPGRVRQAGGGVRLPPDRHRRARPGRDRQGVRPRGRQ